MRPPLLLVRVALVLLILGWPLGPVGAQRQDGDPVRDLMDRMPTQMKVGQLVLLSFPGTDVDAESEVVALLREYGIGGLLLRPQNGNFGAGVIASSDFISMTNALQRVAWEQSQKLLLPGSGELALPNQLYAVPLLVAVESDVDGLPITTFISGCTALPTPLAVGATWNSTLAEQTGEILGRELQALGVNLLLGPDLDVLYNPRSGDAADLGTRALGGDPFWVGELGQAYIQGLHRGSARQLAVSPRHFPGLGSADRPLEQEVPTVQKSLEQLKQIELAPFFSVTAGAPSDDKTAEALLVTHIRYRGFQGNIRLSTRPISLDAQALQAVLKLDEMAPWRNGGGVLIADNLGFPSIRRFYDPRELSFNTRRVAQDALTAGNDLLVLDHFAASDDWGEHFANVRTTLDFLAQRYETDSAFQARVDEALYRVLTLKFRLYSGFSLSATLRDPIAAAGLLGQGGQVTAQVAVHGLTRLAPFSEDLLPAPPQEGERITIFTQEHLVQPVAGGITVTALPRDLIAERLLRLYGPEATRQVQRSAVTSFTFDDLAAALSTLAEGGSSPVLTALQESRWIIFATTGLHPRDPNAGVLKTFLARQASMLDARVVVLAFGPPYDLDSTEISKVDLYYALYSPGEPFVEAGLRALFQDLAPAGNSPVSISGLNYDLARQVMPDSAQVIALSIVGPNGEPVKQESIRKGDTIILRAGTVADSNGHPVPDGTPVQFVLAYVQEGVEQSLVAETLSGVVTTSVTLDRVGQLNITARSEPALSSALLQLTIREDQPVIIVATTPTPVPTPEPTVSPTPAPPPPKEGRLPEPLRLPVPRRGRLLAWGLGPALALAVWGFIWARRQDLDPVAAIRLALWSGCGALGAYVVLMGMMRLIWPAGIYWLASREFWAGGVALVGGLAGLGVAFWLRERELRRDALNLTG